MFANGALRLESHGVNVTPMRTMHFWGAVNCVYMAVLIKQIDPRQFSRSCVQFQIDRRPLKFSKFNVLST